MCRRSAWVTGTGQTKLRVRVLETGVCTLVQVWHLYCAGSAAECARTFSVGLQTLTEVTGVEKIFFIFLRSTSMFLSWPSGVGHERCCPECRTGVRKTPGPHRSVGTVIFNVLSWVAPIWVRWLSGQSVWYWQSPEHLGHISGSLQQQLGPTKHFDRVLFPQIPLFFQLNLFFWKSFAIILQRRVCFECKWELNDVNFFAVKPTRLFLHCCVMQHDTEVSTKIFLLVSFRLV